MLGSVTAYCSTDMNDVICIYTYIYGYGYNPNIRPLSKKVCEGLINYAGADGGNNGKTGNTDRTWDGR